MFSKPHTRGREEDRLGRDLALCESKQKSLGTMNNKSIQKKKKESHFGGEPSAGGEQLLAKEGLHLCTVAAGQHNREHQPRSICRISQTQ